MKSMDNFKETEIGIIPIDWEFERLSDNADFKNGINFTRDEKGDVGFLTIDVLNMYTNHISINLSNLYRVNKKIDESYFLKYGDILFVRSSLKREGVGWASMYEEIEEKVTYCGFIIRARLKTNRINPRFLTYYSRTNTARTSLISSSGKVAITNINQGMLGKLLVPIPPLSEQKNITFILSSVQEAIEKTETVIQATKKLKKSLMNHLFTYGLVPITKREQVQLKETEIGEIPEEWEVALLGDLCDTRTGGTPSRKKPEYFNGDIFWVKSGELEDDYIDTTEERITELGLENSSAKIFPEKTLLVALYGATVGKTTILNVKASTNQAIAAVFPNKERLDTEFLRYYIVISREELLKERYGGAQPNISQMVLKNLKIPEPPLNEQQKIANTILIVDKKIKKEIKIKEVLEALFKSLLENLMTGKVRVKDLNFTKLNTVEMEL